MNKLVLVFFLMFVPQASFAGGYNVNQMSSKGTDIVELMRVKIQSLNDLQTLLTISSPLYQIISSLNPIDATLDLYVGPDHWSVYASAIKESLSGNLKKTMCKSLQTTSLPVYTRAKDFNEADLYFIKNLYDKTCS